MVDVCHQAEDTFSRLGKGERRADASLVNVMLQVVRGKPLRLFFHEQRLVAGRESAERGHAAVLSDPCMPAAVVRAGPAERVVPLADLGAHLARR